MSGIQEQDQIVEVEAIHEDGVGPILRAGEIAEAAIDAIAEDNPGKQVFVLDRGDYIRVNTLHECRLTLESLKRQLGRDYNLARLEIEMPAFAGRIRQTCNEIVWYHATP